MQVFNSDIPFLTQAFYAAIYVLFTYIFVRLFLYVFEAKLERRFRMQTTKIGRLVAFAVILAMLTISAFVPDNQYEWVWFVAQAAVFLIYLIVFCKGTILHKFFWLFITLVFYSVSQLAASLFATMMLKAQLIPLDIEYRPLVAALFAVVMFGAICTLLARQKNHTTEMSPIAILIVSFVPALSCYLLFNWSHNGILVPEVEQLVLSEFEAMMELTAVLSVALINLVVFILYDYMLTKAEESFEQKSLLEQAEISKVHYDELQSLYRETRTWRHDYGNHLQAIDRYARSENLEALNEYISELLGSLDKINFRVSSGNELLDAIVSAKLSHADALGIAAQVKIDTDMSDLPLSAVDCTSLIGNLLDNAIEACQRISDKSEKPEIVLSISRSKKQLTIYEKNSTNGDVRLDEEGKFITSKSKGDHGIGTRQIKAIIEKYRGHVDNTVEEKTFETFITLPM